MAKSVKVYRLKLISTIVDRQLLEFLDKVYKLNVISTIVDKWG